MNCFNQKEKKIVFGKVRKKYYWYFIKMVLHENHIIKLLLFGNAKKGNKFVVENI